MALDREQGLFWWLASLLVAAAIAVSASMPAAASPITYWVADHPDGGACAVDGCYILRLDGGADGSILNTFTANAPGTMVSFAWDPMANVNTATLSGPVLHNQSNGGTPDFYSLTVHFADVAFTDPSPTDWWGSHTIDELYDDSLEDLRANSSGGAQTPNNNDDFSTDFDRIYFAVLDMVLTPIGGADSFTQPGIDFDDCPAGSPAGSFCFDEYPNDPNDKQFFIQRDHRTDGHSEVSGFLAAAGWLQPFENVARPNGYGCCEDLLFVITHKVPEPGTLAIFALGLAMLGFFMRRRRTA